MNEQQNLSNHTKFVPAFHFFLLPVLLLNLIQAGYWLFFSSFGANHAISVRVFIAAFINLLVAIALIVMALLGRLFALGVQDRVIRLEERLRYRQLLPADLQPRINDFTINQLVSLRFASDSELPTLARKVFDGKIDNRKAIKQMIQSWRGDYQRV
jgi:Family of unknown function (DUF6526)